MMTIFDHVVDPSHEDFDKRYMFTALSMFPDRFTKEQLIMLIVHYSGDGIDDNDLERI
jgi:hypothetical protein